LKVENLKRGEIEEVGAAARVIFSGQAGALYAFGYRYDQGKEEEANEAGFPGVVTRQNPRDDNACVENDIHAVALAEQGLGNSRGSACTGGDDLMWREILRQGSIGEVA
jgi:hypothetical protein